MLTTVRHFANCSATLTFSGSILPQASARVSTKSVSMVNVTVAGTDPLPLGSNGESTPGTDYYMTPIWVWHNSAIYQSRVAIIMGLDGSRGRSPRARPRLAGHLGLEHAGCLPSLNAWVDLRTSVRITRQSAGMAAKRVSSPIN